MTRKPRSKFAKEQPVILNTSSLSREKTTGKVIEVMPSFFTRPDSKEPIPFYRYIVQLDNAVGAFGASRRFVFEKDLRAASQKGTLAA